VSLLSAVQEDVLERLGRIGVAARQAVESVLVGQHRSIRRGLSVEFAGHRPYQPGDDLRRLDWAVFARSDRYDVRQYEEETRLRATIAVDCSGSMGYGAPGTTKLDYARRLAAALGFLMIRQADAVGIATCDTAVREHLPPGSTMGHLVNVLDRLEATVPGGETALGPVVQQLAGRLSRRGLVVLITDGYDEPESLLAALRFLRHQRQDVRLFLVADPTEESFPHAGVVRFLGLEGEPPVLVDADRVRGFYREAFAAHRQRLAEGCHAINVRLETVRTDEDLALVLVRALSIERGRR
jgi:uncharacterized protein (DUF58 family)